MHTYYYCHYQILFVSDNMHPFFISIIIGAALRFSSVNGIDIDHQAAYDRVTQCISKGMHTHQSGHNLPFETAICDSFKV